MEPFRVVHKRQCSGPSFLETAFGSVSGSLGSMVDNFLLKRDVEPGGAIKEHGPGPRPGGRGGPGPGQPGAPGVPNPLPPPPGGPRLRRPGPGQSSPPGPPLPPAPAGPGNPAGPWRGGPITPPAPPGMPPRGGGWRQDVQDEDDPLPPGLRNQENRFRFWSLFVNPEDSALERAWPTKGGAPVTPRIVGSGYRINHQPHPFPASGAASGGASETFGSRQSTRSVIWASLFAGFRSSVSSVLGSLFGQSVALPAPGGVPVPFSFSVTPHAPVSVHGGFWSPSYQHHAGALGSSSTVQDQ